jgi:anti-sigma regulatory factor (Ser/Thr protein kinase)
MNASACEVELELPPDPSSVSKARHAVIELAQATGAPEQEVALAVSEAVGNSVVHAFRFGKVGTIRVLAQTRDSAFIVIVSDNGVGMIPDVDNPGLGVGTSLISRLSKEATFESSEDGTTVTMRFDLKEGG